MESMILFGVIINGFLFGIFSASLASHKGYEGYFWTGFFFSFIGLIYVAALPRKEGNAVSEVSQAEAREAIAITLVERINKIKES